MADFLRNPIETLRTAPVQFTTMALNSGAVTLCLKTFIETDGFAPRLVNGIGAAANIVSVAFNGYLALGRVEIRDHLEDVLEKDGFSEERFEKYTTTYCSRQAARVACQNYGVLPEYEELYLKNPDRDFKWLPHV